MGFLKNALGRLLGKEQPAHEDVVTGPVSQPSFAGTTPTWPAFRQYILYCNRKRSSGPRGGWKHKSRDWRNK